MSIAKHIVLTILFTFGVVATAYAQSADDAPKMRELKGKDLLGPLTPLQNKKGQWGYVNDENKFIIKPVFDEALPFEGNVARICSEGKWGVLSRNGLYVVDPVYDIIKEFSADSIAIIGRKREDINDMHYGLISSRGKICQYIVYSYMEPRAYGFLGQKGLKYSTIDKYGATIHNQQFDAVYPLEEERVVDMFFKDGKWGIIKDGKDILAHKWNQCLSLLYKNEGSLPDFFTGRQGKYIGVTTSEGKQVASNYFDKIEFHESGKYFITVRNGKFGALTLKMSEIVPPILDEIPVIGDNIYRVYDGYDFWCANTQGRVKFIAYADYLEAVDPEAYATTTEYPEWAKASIIEENLLNRDNEIDKARQLCEVMAKRDYDISIARFDPNVPKEFAMSYLKSDKDRYGVRYSEKFIESRGSIDLGNSPQLQIRQKSSDASIFFASDDAGEKHYILAGDKLISLNDALDKFNIKSCSSLYIKDYVRLSDNRFMLSVAFVRSSDEATESLIETDPYLLPVSNSVVNIFSGTPNTANESYGIFTFDIPSVSAISFAQLPADSKRFIASKFGGFYSCSSQSLIADTENTVCRYDRSGNLEWKFTADYEEVLLSIEETENFTYLCGYTKNSGSERPLIVQINKQGQRTGSYTKEYQNSRFSGIKVDNYLIYAKLEGDAGSKYGTDFYPHYLLEDLGDNIYIRPCCAWEDWGGKIIGGCGLITNGGKWVQSPIIESSEDDEICSLYNWEFGKFVGDYLIVRYNGKYGVINREGDIVVTPRYELLEHLENPNYFRVMSGYYYGVIDATGRIIVPIEYEYIGRMEEDMIVARKDGVYGCFDKDGRNVVPFDYQEIKEYVGGMARICEKSRFGFIDKNGQDLVAPFSDDVENFCEDCALVTIKNKVGFVNLQGDWIVPTIYEDASSFSGGLAAVCMNKKYGYINKSGEYVIPARYDFADKFNPDHKIARISNGDKWGVVDMSGNEVVMPIYDEIVICADGYICVKKDGKSGILSPLGKEIYPVVCDKVDITSKGYMFRHGVATASAKGMLIKVDMFGNEIVNYVPKP